MNPILLLHGALGSRRQLEPLKLLLEKRGRKVLTMNFSGHGGEDYALTGFGIETFAEDVGKLLTLQDVRQVDIFGYSMGGYIALWLAYKHPEKVGRIVTLGTKFDWNEESAAREVRKLNPEKILEKVPGFARLLEQRHAPQDWKKLLFRTGEMMTRLGRQPLLTPAILKTIKHPILICLGDQDDTAERSHSEQVADLLADGRFVLFENTAHPIEKVNSDLLIKVIQGS